LDEIRKKGSEKGPKKGYPGFQVPFSSLFGSLYPFHAVWVLLWFLKGHIAPQVYNKDSGYFFLDFIGYSVTFICQTRKRAQKRTSKGYCE
jgi:hypothetical protein